MDKILWVFRVKDDSEIVSDECVGIRFIFIVVGYVNVVVIMVFFFRVILGSSIVIFRYIYI